jgi:3-hydroxyisobutyrate dehydrogenase-like beta-hydroxyacid dehydrogenase
VDQSLASVLPNFTGGCSEPSHNRVSGMKVGFVGLGRMGSVMAATLVIAGCRVLGYVRRPGRAEELAAHGIKPVTTIDDIVESDVVITMLPDDPAMRQVVFGDQQLCPNGLAARLAPGSIHLSMSTISPQCAVHVADEHARRKQGYVAAPVFGNPDAARARELFIVAAGAVDDIARCRPLLDVLGQRTFIVGSTPSAANVIKLAGNAMSAVTLEIIGEVLALGRKRGVDPEMLITVLTESLFGGRVHRIYGGKIAREQYSAGGFVVPIALKDIRLVLGEAETAAVPMPTVSAVRDRLVTAMATGHGHLDWTALGLVAAEEAGLTSTPSPIQLTQKE